MAVGLSNFWQAGESQHVTQLELRLKPAEGCHRGPQAGVPGMGQSQSQRGLRPGAFPEGILSRPTSVKLSEIAESLGCSKASASDIRPGKWAPHVSTWGALGALVGLDAVGTVRSMTKRSPVAEYPRLGVVPTSPHRRLAEALAPAEKA